MKMTALFVSTQLRRVGDAFDARRLYPRSGSGPAGSPAKSARDMWRQFRRQIPRDQRETARVNGKIYNRSHDAEVAQFVRDLIGFWKTPSAIVPRPQSRPERLGGPRHQN